MCGIMQFVLLSHVAWLVLVCREQEQTDSDGYAMRTASKRGPLRLFRWSGARVLL